MPTLAPMKIEERYQYLRRMQPRYRQARRQEKSQLLDEMEAHTGLHRKSLTRLLHSTLVRQARRRVPSLRHRGIIKISTSLWR